MRRYPAIAATALTMTSPAQAEFLTKPEAKRAVRKQERKLQRKDYIETYKVGRCQRRGDRRVRCYVKETYGGLVFDGWTGVWLRDGKTSIHYRKPSK